MSIKDLFRDVPANNLTKANQNSVQEKLSFVTIIAWVFIIAIGFRSLTFLTLIFMNIHRVHYIDLGTTKLVFPMTIMSHAQLYLAFYLTLSLMMLIPSVGLLKRKQWGRLMFIILLTIAIIWDLVDFFFPNLSYAWVVPGLVRTSASDRQLLEMYRSSHIYSIAFWDIVHIVFYGWIIKKLLSKDIRKGKVLGLDI